MKSKDKRKQRRQVVQEPTNSVGVVEKMYHKEDPCPECGISEMRNVVGGAKICPLCEAERRKQNATAKVGFRK